MCSIMNDSTLEIISLGVVIVGLIIGFFIVFDYEPVDAFFAGDDPNSFIKGNISKISYSDSGWTYMEIYACKTFNAFYEGEIKKEMHETIFVEGAMYKDSLTVNAYK